MTLPERRLLEQLRPALASGTIQIVADAAPYWEWLNQTFPACGSKIDLDKVAWLVDYPAWRTRFSSPRDLWLDVLAQPQMRSVSRMTAVSDGNVNFALVGATAAFTECMNAVATYMLHLYMFDEEARLCFCITMEGDAFLCGR